jgi:hypothetical protein
LPPDVSFGRCGGAGNARAAAWLAWFYVIGRNDGASPVNTLLILNDPPYDTERVYVD